MEEKGREIGEGRKGERERIEGREEEGREIGEGRKGGREGCRDGGKRRRKSVSESKRERT